MLPYAHGLHVGSHILIEPFSRATLMFAYFKGLAHAHFVAKAPFVFSLHILDDREVHIKVMGTVLEVLSDT